MSEIVEALRNLSCEVSPCGSRVTNDPPPVGTDEDFLVVVPDDRTLSKLLSVLDDAGFEWEGDSQHYQQLAQSDFMSWRRGEENLIVTKSTEFARRHKLATAVVKHLNLPAKADRITVFQAILYGNAPGDFGSSEKRMLKEPVPDEEIAF